ncbi:Uncharacterised protein [Mycobacteroides abscessus subsp. abscessus]|nr:Uncharacterised protein [Mycobacteroides abscessus subsp. abscessus]
MLQMGFVEVRLVVVVGLKQMQKQMRMAFLGLLLVAQILVHLELVQRHLEA